MTFQQKSPECPQKSPTYPQKSPLFHKRALRIRKTALQLWLVLLQMLQCKLTIQNTFYYEKALHVRQRALHICSGNALSEGFVPRHAVCA